MARAGARLSCPTWKHRTVPHVGLQLREQIKDKEGVSGRFGPAAVCPPVQRVPPSLSALSGVVGPEGPRGWAQRPPLSFCSPAEQQMILFNGDKTSAPPGPLGTLAWPRSRCILRTRCLCSS